MSMIPYGRQEINQSDIDAVVEVLSSDFLTQGPLVPRFERTVASHVGAQYAVAANSATSALHIACLALDLKPGDLLWTSPITFVASANCGLYCGAEVDFVDIDPQTYNLCPVSLEKKLQEAERSERLPKVVIPVHLCGQSCDMAAIAALARRYGFKIIEDASHAIGGKYDGEFVGNCRYSDITVFSFHPVKIVTTAEGGLALTNNAELAEKMALYSSHGITRNPDQMCNQPHGAWYYEQIALGYNYRMTELQAALGVSQMKRLDHYISVRAEIARRYHELLRDMPITLPWVHPNIKSSWHLYVIRIKQDAAPYRDRNRIFNRMRQEGIGVNVHYIPVHLQPYYQTLGPKSKNFPHAELYYSQAISLPIHPGITKSLQDRIVYTLHEALGQ